MNIQEAVKICQRETKPGKPQLFARPIAWEGTGSAIDLGRKLAHDKTRKICVFSSHALTGVPWEVDPEELLERWQVVTRDQLTLEAAGEPRTDK